MTIRGDVVPGAFTLEQIPKSPGKTLIRFYLNPREWSETKDGVTEKGWEWDEYHLESPTYAGLEADVIANYDSMLAQAQALEEEENKIPEAIAKLAATTDDITDIQSALADVYEMIISGGV